MMTSVVALVHGPNHNFGGASVFVVVVLLLIVVIFARVYGRKRK